MYHYKTAFNMYLKYILLKGRVIQQQVRQFVAPFQSLVLGNLFYARFRLRTIYGLKPQVEPYSSY